MSGPMPYYYRHDTPLILCTLEEAVEHGAVALDTISNGWYNTVDITLDGPSYFASRKFVTNIILPLFRGNLQDDIAVGLWPARNFSWEDLATAWINKILARRSYLLAITPK